MSTTVADLPELPALVDGVVAHRRRGPVAHVFRSKAYQWLVDLDRLPVLPWYLRPFAGFRSGDHLAGELNGGPGAGRGTASPGAIKSNVLGFLGRNGIQLGAEGRVVMLANARVFGHVFDPLSVFWCFGSDGELRCLIAEVHNTYGGRHAYLLELDSAGDTETDKAFYVSPFNDVSGRYRMHFELSQQRVGVRITLHREGFDRFDATFSGRVRRADRRAVAGIVVRRPAMPFKVSAMIRVHGIVLWLKGLPVVPRPLDDGVGAHQEVGAATPRTTDRGGCPVNR